MMTVDPSEKGAQYKREQLSRIINLTEEQKTIIDLYILEEKTKIKHWEMDPEDRNIYLEWLNGTNILRNKINARINQTRKERQQIAMNNNSNNQQNSSQYGNSPKQQIQKPQSPPKDAIIRTASGKEIPAAERPDLYRSASKSKRYPRRNR